MAACFFMCATAPRTIVYVDGFNLYYGAIRGSPYRWLDLQRYFAKVRPVDDIQAIKYFTAPVTGMAGSRQDALLRAFGTLPRVEVILGAFKLKRISCTFRTCPRIANGTPGFDVPEEKRTDVNIALHMLDDAYQQLCDRQVLVSGDSDMVPAVRMVQRRFPDVRIHVYVPARVRRRGAAVELRGAAHRSRTLPLNLMANSLLPNPVIARDGTVIHKPLDW
ncbi:MAG: NYN domain-containing protein [Gammaproteobacteria bacterium]|nr:NYN domain-containing protein [Gammaproteobacteria bacterium]